MRTLISSTLISLVCLCASSVAAADDFSTNSGLSAASPDALATTGSNGSLTASSPPAVEFSAVSAPPSIKASSPLGALANELSPPSASAATASLAKPVTEKTAEPVSAPSLQGPSLVSAVVTPLPVEDEDSAREEEEARHTLQALESQVARGVNVGNTSANAANLIVAEMVRPAPAPVIEPTHKVSSSRSNTLAVNARLSTELSSLPKSPLPNVARVTPAKPAGNELSAAANSKAQRDSNLDRDDSLTLLMRYGNAAQEVILKGLKFVGVNYRFGGNNEEGGLDCSGYVRLVFRESIGALLPRTAREMSEVGEKIASHELQPGDLVFFNTMRRTFSHVGIYLGDNHFIHAPRSGSQVRVESMDAYWLKRFNGARRIIGQSVAPRLGER